MSRKEQNRVIFLVFSGSLYILMTWIIPMQKNISEMIAWILAPITFGISVISAFLYVVLLKKTNYIFVSELFSLIGIGLIIATLLTFPYA